MERKYIIILIIVLSCSCVMSSALGGGATFFFGDEVNKWFGQKETTTPPSGDKVVPSAPNSNSLLGQNVDTSNNFTNTMLKHDFSNKCLDGNGTDIYYNVCNPYNDNMQWNYDGNKLTHKATGKCLDINQSNEVKLVNCPSVVNWLYDGSMIKKKGEDKCMYSNAVITSTGACDSTDSRYRYGKV